MKHLKTFENLKDEIEVGDWCVVRDDVNIVSLPKYENFKKYPCQVESAIKTSEYDISLKLRYGDFWTFFKENEIAYHSKNKEDVQAFLDAKKYNL